MTGEAAFRVAEEPLKRFVRAVFIKAGMGGGDADVVADILVWANLRGVDSHGVLRVPRYLRFIDMGWLNPQPHIRLDRETVATFLMDADRAVGPVAMTKAMDTAIAKARHAGVGWGVVRGMTHAGAIGYYTLMASRADMVGLCFVGSIPNMAYHGARAAGISTAPIAIGVPGADHPPLMLDMATAMISIGRIAHARDSGTPLPEGVALNDAGVPTTDADEASLPLPLGGPKGSGLSLMMECLTGVLAGAPILSRFVSGAEKGHRQNGVVVAVDIAAFTDPADYGREIDHLVDTIKSLPKADGVEELLAPGERGDRILRERSRDGIEMAAGTWTKLREVADRFGLPMPETL